MWLARWWQLLALLLLKFRKIFKISTQNYSIQNSDPPCTKREGKWWLGTRFGLVCCVFGCTILPGRCWMHLGGLLPFITHSITLLFLSTHVISISLLGPYQCQHVFLHAPSDSKLVSNPPSPWNLTSSPLPRNSWPWQLWDFISPWNTPNWAPQFSPLALF